MQLKITILRKMRYEESFVYVLHFGYVFQYLLSWNNEIHMDYITVKPNLSQRIKYWLRLKSLYTQEQTDRSTEIMLSGAMKTIDALIKKGGRMSDRSNIKRIEKAKEKRNNTKCQWQAVNTDHEDKYWMCLTHGVAVKMVDGVKPFHK